MRFERHKLIFGFSQKDREISSGEIRERSVVSWIFIRRGIGIQGEMIQLSTVPGSVGFCSAPFCSVGFCSILFHQTVTFL